MWRFFLVFMIGLLCAYYYLETVPADCLQECGSIHRGIIAGTADSPYRYRLLSAWIVQPFAGDGSDLAIAQSYILAYFLFVPAMMLAVYVWMRCWVKEVLALLSIILLAAYFPLMYEVWGISLYSVLEIIFLCVGLLILRAKPRYWTVSFFLIVILATLNRETAVLLPLIFALTEIDSWRRSSYWLRLGAFGCAWLIVFAGLRLILGAAPNDVSIATAWQLNTAGGWWSWKAMLKNLFFLPIWISYGLQIRRAPIFLQRLIPACLVYLVLFVVFGFWEEVRLLLPLLILTMPAAMTMFESPRMLATVKRLQ